MLTYSFYSSLHFFTCFNISFNNVVYKTVSTQDITNPV